MPHVYEVSKTEHGGQSIMTHNLGFKMVQDSFTLGTSKTFLSSPSLCH